MKYYVFTLILACSNPAIAQDGGAGPKSNDLGATNDNFTLQGGEAIYQGACSGCHQPQGQGAVGAAMYPPLSANPRLQDWGYPVHILLNGHAGMPNFAQWLDDKQIADVVGYLMTNFANRYSPVPTAEDVAAARKPPME